MKTESAPHIVITEAFSPEHLGNWALVECAVKQLRQAVPDCRLTILARDPEEIGRISGETAVEKLFPSMPHHAGLPAQIFWLIPNCLWAVMSTAAVFCLGVKSGSFIRLFTYSKNRLASLNALLDADLVVSIAGESINEHFYKKLPFVLYTYWFAALLGKPVILFPQSFGPLHSPLLREFTRRVLDKCLVLMPRDRESVRLLKELGIAPEKSPFVPDIAVAQEQASPQEAWALLREHVREPERRPRLGVVPAAFAKSDNRHLEELAGALRRWLDEEPEGQVLVFIGNRSGRICACKDREIAERLVRSIGTDSRVTPLMNFAFSPSQIKAIFAELDVVVSCRLHATVLSTMAGTPTIAIATQPKLRDYMELCDQGEFVFDAGSAGEQVLVETIARAMTEWQDIRSRLGTARERLQAQCASASAYASTALSDAEAVTSRG